MVGHVLARRARGALCGLSSGTRGDEAGTGRARLAGRQKASWHRFDPRGGYWCWLRGGDDDRGRWRACGRRQFWRQARGAPVCGEDVLGRAHGPGGDHDGAVCGAAADGGGAPPAVRRVVLPRDAWARAGGPVDDGRFPHAVGVEERRVAMGGGGGVDSTVAAIVEGGLAEQVEGGAAAMVAARGRHRGPAGLMGAACARKRPVDGRRGVFRVKRQRGHNTVLAFCEDGAGSDGAAGGGTLEADQYGRWVIWQALHGSAEVEAFVVDDNRAIAPAQVLGDGDGTNNDEHLWRLLRDQPD